MVVRDDVSKNNISFFMNGIDCLSEVGCGQFPLGQFFRTNFDFHIKLTPRYTVKWQRRRFNLLSYRTSACCQRRKYMDSIILEVLAQIQLVPWLYQG